MVTLAKRYEAAMILSGVGDAMGFRNGIWEFCNSGIDIHAEASALGGIDKLNIKKPDWLVSDDTVMHLATAEAYMDTKDKKDKELLYTNIAKKYKECMNDMAGRSPGPTTMNSCHALNPLRVKGYQIPFDPRGGGCGAAMRSMCIGLQYPRPEDLDDLIADSIESGRMTHHHPTGYLGSMTGALFTSYAIQNKQVTQWGEGLMKTLHRAREYIKKSGYEVEENLKAWDYFENAWKKYLDLRNLTSGNNRPVFPQNFDIEARDNFYSSLSFAGWGGASGHDAPMIAYDATLGSDDSWIELCKRGILHSGDNDSTGVMAGCWFGARFGFLGVPDNHYKKLEYRDRLKKAADGLLKSSIKYHQQNDSQTACPDSSQSSIESSQNDGNSNEGSQSYAHTNEISLSSKRSGDGQEDSIESSKDSQQENSSLTSTSDENTHKSSADVTEEPTQKKEKKDEKSITDV